MTYYPLEGGGFLSEEPKLIVTCRTSSEELCMHEVGNVLYPKDPSVRVVYSGFPGVVFVYTSLSVERAFKALAFREYGFVENIIPINCTTATPPTISDLRSCIASLTLPTAVKVRVKARGVRGLSSRLFTMVVELLKEMGSQHDSSLGTCLFVEVFTTKTYIGVAPCQPVFKPSM
jgi:Predicted RNA-binding protein, contains THUMP domain